MADPRLTPERIADVRRVADAVVLSVPRHIVPLDDARAVRETIIALIEENALLALDLSYERAKTRACDATGVEWRRAFIRTLAIESDVGTPEEMEYHMERLIEKLHTAQPDPMGDCHHGCHASSCKQCAAVRHIEALEDRLVVMAREHEDEIAALTAERDALPTPELSDEFVASRGDHSMARALADDLLADGWAIVRVKP